MKKVVICLGFMWLLLTTVHQAYSQDAQMDSMENLEVINTEEVANSDTAAPAEVQANTENADVDTAANPIAESGY